MIRFLLCILLGFISVAHVGFSENNTIILGKENTIKLTDFFEVVYCNSKVTLSEKAKERLDETREFVNYLLDNNIKVYGLTTGFADLRNFSVSSQDSSKLSDNIIESHDAAIGNPLDDDIVLGAMFLRANSLAQGNSAFKSESLEIILAMINKRIIPIIPRFGSLGASGDLAYLARLGRAMKGDAVAVKYKGKIVLAKEALESEGISPFTPSAKEGLALTNGTSFMASMMAIAYFRQLHEIENALALQGMFVNSVRAVDAAFDDSIHISRGQFGQQKIAEFFKEQLKNSPFTDHLGIQNDYSTRCLPQILGPKIELIINFYKNIENELNAVTDNPLIYKNEEISKDIYEGRLLPFNGDNWTVLSGGNFHGEYIATSADCLAMSNAKVALTMERQMTVLLNPDRNQKLFPAYLIADDENVGLLSGYMIPQYVGNALAQKIAMLGNPASIYNITSGNESEDVVSYGATAALKLLEQLDIIHNFNTVYMTIVMQAYSLARQDLLNKGIEIPENLCCEKIYQDCLKHINPDTFPTIDDIPFDQLYEKIDSFLNTTKIRQTINFPISKELKCDVIIN